jgi:hypothetical protein
VGDSRTLFYVVTAEALGQSFRPASRAVTDEHTISVRHSPENNLRALGLVHDRILDAELMYHAGAASPRQPSLIGEVAPRLGNREGVSAMMTSRTPAAGTGSLLTSSSWP